MEKNGETQDANDTYLLDHFGGQGWKSGSQFGKKSKRSQVER